MITTQNTHIRYTRQSPGWSQVVPGSSHSEPLTDLSMGQLLTLLRSRKLSPVELVEAHIARIQAVNPMINALVVDRFAAARVEAKAAELRYAAPGSADVLPPLLGVPCSIKDFVAVQGLPQTGGLVRRKDEVATADATVTARLRRAGAVILGVSNGPEGGMWMETNNLIYGRTRNPWDVRRTSGGSSGGEGALVGSGGTVFGIGSDIGGSVRIPAAFCGVVGHKPSQGLVPNTGHFPPAVAGEQHLVIGPLCRRVEDVMPILRVIAGQDGVDDTVRPWALGDPAAVDVGKVEVFSLLGSGRGLAHPAMRAAVDSSAAALLARGARKATLDLPDLRHGFWMWAAAMTSAHPAGYADLLSNGNGFSVLGELLRVPLGQGRYIMPSLITVLAEQLMRLLPAREQQWLTRADRLASALDERLGEHGVILMPPYSRPAPRHHMPLLTPFDTGYTGLWSVLGYPATVVPLGFDEDGLPVAIQVISRRGNDHLTLAVAAALEHEFGGWTRAEPNPHSPSNLWF